MGNTISNSRDISGNVRLRMETLYNHVPFLRKVNRKFSASNSGSRQEEVKKFTKEIQLKPDTTVTVAHNQKTKRIRVSAILPDGSSYRVRYKVRDNNTIEILTQDTARIKLTVLPRKRTEDEWWYKALEYTTRVAMMVRSINVSYSNRYNMTLPGFLPNIGDFFGQRSSDGLQPGLDFAFGFTDESYIRRAAEKGWLLQDENSIFFYAGVTDETDINRAKYKIIATFKEDGRLEVRQEDPANEIGFALLDSNPTYEVREEPDATLPYLTHYYVTMNLKYSYDDVTSMENQKIRYNVEGTMTMERKINEQIPDEDQAIQW